MSKTYLTTDQLAKPVHHDSRTIRDRRKDCVLLDGTDCLRPFDGRKLLFVWGAIDRDIKRCALAHAGQLADGGISHG